MKRSMMHAYLKDTGKAVAFYQKAFNAELVASYPNPDGTYYHAELDIYGQIFSLSEAEYSKPETGNTMQFCLHFGEGDEELILKIYNVLKEDAKFVQPPASTDWSPLMAGVIDKFGVNWGIFI